jgi:hypothetical protein
LTRRETVGGGSSLGGGPVNPPAGFFPRPLPSSARSCARCGQQALARVPAAHGRRPWGLASRHGASLLCIGLLHLSLLPFPPLAYLRPTHTHHKPQSGPFRTCRAARQTQGAKKGKRKKKKKKKVKVARASKPAARRLDCRPRRMARIPRRSQESASSRGKTQKRGSTTKQQPPAQTLS